MGAEEVETVPVHMVGYKVECGVSGGTAVGFRVGKVVGMGL